MAENHDDRESSSENNSKDADFGVTVQPVPEPLLTENARTLETSSIGSVHFRFHLLKRKNVDASL